MQRGAGQVFEDLLTVLEVLPAEGGNGWLPSLNLVEFKEGKCRCFFNRAKRVIDALLL